MSAENLIGLIVGVLLTIYLFVALVPYWAVWPFETLVLPRRHLGSFTDLTPA